MAACYVLKQDDEVMIIETGTKDTVPLILAFLKSHNIQLEQVKYVAVTHVHLDHAGGAGLLMQALPNATLVVHPLGARHMISPAKLQAGATAVYGEEEFERTYGDLLPIDENRILIADDNFVIKLGDRALTFIDTPGHARHHFCIFDSLSNGFFTGDTFGLAYQELATEQGPFIFPTTTPVQFDPDALKHSINRMISFNPDRMFLTHYGMVESPAKLAKSLIAQVDVLVDMALKHKALDSTERVKAIEVELMDSLLAGLGNHGCKLDTETKRQVLASDVLLNAQGLDVWLSRQ
jgi:glyoxylase-like metal-dependent hydrolase (beta-lactamase superfamily II)